MSYHRCSNLKFSSKYIKRFHYFFKIYDQKKIKFDQKSTGQMQLWSILLTYSIQNSFIVKCWGLKCWGVFDSLLFRRGTFFSLYSIFSSPTAYSRSSFHTFLELPLLFAHAFASYTRLSYNFFTYMTRLGIGFTNNCLLNFWFSLYFLRKSHFYFFLLSSSVGL